MNILIGFDGEDVSHVSAALLYIQGNNPDIKYNLIKKEDMKNQKIDLKASDFNDISDILKIIKLDFLPAIDYDKVYEIVLENKED
jgi:hypothetical protein